MWLTVLFFTFCSHRCHLSGELETDFAVWYAVLSFMVRSFPFLPCVRYLSPVLRPNVMLVRGISLSSLLYDAAPPCALFSIVMMRICFVFLFVPYALCAITTLLTGHCDRTDHDLSFGQEVQSLFHYRPLHRHLYCARNHFYDHCR